MNPSDFTEQPWSSIFYKSEPETIITNIMVILKRTGNIWRELSEEEYIKEREKDGGYGSSELQYFRQVVEYTTSAVKASRVSKSWAKIYDTHNPILEHVSV